MRKTLQLLSCLTLAATATSPAATNLALSSTMNGDSFLAEYDITGVQAQINFGNGQPGDADGLYNVSNLSQSFGSVNLFPNESTFTIGQVSYDETSLTGIGVETIGIASFTPSLTTDLSATAFEEWFGGPASFSFGPLDAGDQLTFTDGVLSAINLNLSTSFTAAYFNSTSPTTYNGSFIIAGSAISLLIDDTQSNVDFTFGVAPSSRFQSSILGSVNAVPEPSTYALIGLAAGAGLWLRRRKKASV